MADDGSVSSSQRSGEGLLEVQTTKEQSEAMQQRERGHADADVAALEELFVKEQMSVAEESLMRLWFRPM